MEVLSMYSSFSFEYEKKAKKERKKRKEGKAFAGWCLSIALTRRKGKACICVLPGRTNE
jgi:hypothetical protein